MRRAATTRACTRASGGPGLNFSERVGAQSSLRGAFGTSKTIATANMSQIAVAHTAAPSVSGISPSTGHLGGRASAMLGRARRGQPAFNLSRIPMCLWYCVFWYCSPKNGWIGRIHDECLRVDGRRRLALSCLIVRSRSTAVNVILVSTTINMSTGGS